MDLSPARKFEQMIHPECVDLMAKTWHFANIIRGRREKMITKVYFELFSPTDYLPRFYNFKVRKNKYFDFSATLSANNEGLEDIPTNDMYDWTMINSTHIIRRCNTDLLQCIRYIVKQCTRLSLIFVRYDIAFRPIIIFAPIAMRGRNDFTTRICNNAN
jgi:hypothetical protein